MGGAETAVLNHTWPQVSHEKMDMASLPCSPGGAVMEIMPTPHNFSGLKNVLVDKEALNRISGDGGPSQLKEKSLDDVVWLVIIF